MAKSLVFFVIFGSVLAIGIPIILYGLYKIYKNANAIPIKLRNPMVTAFVVIALMVFLLCMCVMCIFSFLNVVWIYCI